MSQRVGILMMMIICYRLPWCRGGGGGAERGKGGRHCCVPNGRDANDDNNLL